MSTSKKQTKRQTAKKQNGKGLLWLIAGAALILVIALGGLYLKQADSPSTSAALPSEISVDEAAIKRDAGAFILDVREQEEWLEYHIPGATLIPLGELEARANEVPPDQEVVVVCRSGNRSQVGRDILRNAGFNQVTSMAGGMKQWSANGYDTVSGP